MKYDTKYYHDEESDFKYHEWEKCEDFSPITDGLRCGTCGASITILEYVDKKLEESKWKNLVTMVM